MLEELMSERRRKIERLREAGLDPYPPKSERANLIREVLADFENLPQDKDVAVAGRVLAMREHGGSIFLDLHDGTEKMQVYLKLDVLGEDAFNLLKETVDIADFIDCSGTPTLTKRGEKSIMAKEWRMLAKAMRPLPEKWHGLQDPDARFRQRYLDTLMNEEVKQKLVVRSKIISAIREFLDARDFLEVETPTLQPIYGGGFAKPFVTHHNALGHDFYLRISDEMYLKRLIVGGFPKVYEITKVFRNEGIDHDHNPEFTMFEAQIAYEDYRYGMDLIEEVFEYVALKVLGTTTLPFGDTTIDVKRPWQKMSMLEAIQAHAGLDTLTWQSKEEALKALQGTAIPKDKLEEAKRLSSVGELIAFAFEKLVEEKLIQPTIIYDYPVEVSPLAKRAKDPRFVERFEYFAFGSELGNNYSELNDALDLRQRFIEEKKKKAAGFEEAHQDDEDYVIAIEHGFPPTCGLSIGIDRMVMLYTNAENIKEIIPFPTLRPKE